MKLKGFDGEYIYRIDSKTSKNLFFDDLANNNVKNFEVSKDLGKYIIYIIFNVNNI